MSPSEHHLLTGATGFVGGAIALELLDRADAMLSCVVRPNATQSADERLREALHKAARLYGREDLAGEINSRCRGVAGDITQPDCGVTADIAKVDQVWHIAASLAFRDEEKDQILDQNVNGTRHTVTLADSLGAACFNHVSTAYVSGDRIGHIAPALVVDDSHSNNWYERSKIAAELIAAEAGFDCLRIFRPGVVIGHSETFGANSEVGLYGGLIGFVRFSAQLKMLGCALAEHQVRVRMTSDSLINLVPVDRVAHAAVSVIKASDRSEVYHLTNAAQTLIADLLESGANALGIPTPICVSDDSELTPLDRQVDEFLTFYRYYANGTRHYDLTTVNRHIGDEVLNVPMPRHRLDNFVDAFFKNRTGLHTL